MIDKGDRYVSDRREGGSEEERVRQAIYKTRTHHLCGGKKVASCKGAHRPRNGRFGASFGCMFATPGTDLALFLSHVARHGGAASLLLGKSDIWDCKWSLLVSKSDIWDCKWSLLLSTSDKF